ncbi:MAG: AAA family ATPase [Pseudomonadota bacterium]
MARYRAAMKATTARGPENTVGNIKLRSIILEDFRAFGAPVRLDNLREVNIITGPNNVGKSSVLMPLRRLTRLDERFVPRVGSPDGLGLLAEDHYAVFRPGDFRLGGKPPRVRLSLEVPDMPAILASFFAADSKSPPPVQPCPSRISIELTGSSSPPIKIGLPDADRELLVRVHASFPAKLVHRMGSSDDHHFALQLAKMVAQRVLVVPSFRLSPKSLTPPDPSEHEERRYDGSSLLADLLLWHLPDPQTGTSPQVDKARKLNAVVSEMLQEQTRIWPSLEDGVRVAVGGDPGRRLDDLGQGVAQIITIAAGLLSMPMSPILLLEEPEICLHPGLQRQLVEYLTGSGIQTLITTHSNHLIDASHNARIYLIRYDAVADTRHVKDIDDSILSVLHDLGVTASSIAAANAVLWVEGPSDAMYIRHWLTRDSVGKTLREGHDYSFAFHGGALLKHFSIDGDGGLVRLLTGTPAAADQTISRD